MHLTMFSVLLCPVSFYLRTLLKTTNSYNLKCAYWWVLTDLCLCKATTTIRIQNTSDTPKRFLPVPDPRQPRLCLSSQLALSRILYKGTHTVWTLFCCCIMIPRSIHMAVSEFTSWLLSSIRSLYLYTQLTCSFTCWWILELFPVWGACE